MLLGKSNDKKKMKERKSHEVQEKREKILKIKKGETEGGGSKEIPPKIKLSISKVIIASKDIVLYVFLTCISISLIFISQPHTKSNNRRKKLWEHFLSAITEIILKKKLLGYVPIFVCMCMCVDKIYINVCVKEEKKLYKRKFSMYTREKVDVAVEPKTIDHV